MVPNYRLAPEDPFPAAIHDVAAAYRFLLKTEQQQVVLKEIFKFLRKTPNIIESDLKGEFIKLLDKLKLHEHDSYEQRPFLYFDIISWLQSKINGTDIQTEIQKKISAKNALKQIAI